MNRLELTSIPASNGEPYNIRTKEVPICPECCSDLKIAKRRKGNFHKSSIRVMECSNPNCEYLERIETELEELIRQGVFDDPEYDDIRIFNKKELQRVQPNPYRKRNLIKLTSNLEDYENTD